MSCKIYLSNKILYLSKDLTRKYVIYFSLTERVQCFKISCSHQIYRKTINYRPTTLYAIYYEPVSNKNMKQKCCTPRAMKVTLQF